MDYWNRLDSLGGHLQDAQDHVESALRHAVELVRSVPEDVKPGWPEMDELVKTLEAVHALLDPLPGKSLSDEMEKASQELDDLADRADAASY